MTRENVGELQPKDLELIAARKSMCEKELLPQFPGRNFEEIRKGLLFSAEEKIPVVLQEWNLWDQLETERYWQVHPKLKLLAKSGRSIPESDIAAIAQMMIRQVYRGRYVATDMPVYSDIWTELQQDDSPIKKYVSDDEVRKALNTGFWHYMKMETTGWPSESVLLCLAKVFDHPNFHTVFDYAEGAKQTMALERQVIPGSISDLHRKWTEWTWGRYLVWYLTQSTTIYASIKSDQTDEKCGNVLAPLIYHYLVHTDHGYQPPSSMNLLSFFVGDDWDNTRRASFIQNALAKAYEHVLSRILTDIGDCVYSVKSLERIGNSIVDKTLEIRIREQVWNAVCKLVNRDKLQPGAEKHIPPAAMAKSVDDAEQTVANGDFNVHALRSWMTMPGEYVGASRRGRARNAALGKYFSMGRRPKKSELSTLSSMLEHFGAMQHKASAYVCLDMIKRGDVAGANELLLRYNTMTLKCREQFLSAASEYRQNLGPVKVRKEMLQPNAAYPHYNAVADFVKKWPAWFSIKPDPVADRR